MCQKERKPGMHLFHVDDKAGQSSLCLEQTDQFEPRFLCPTYSKAASCCRKSLIHIT